MVEISHSAVASRQPSDVQKNTFSTLFKVSSLMQIQFHKPCFSEVAVTPAQSASSVCSFRFNIDFRENGRLSLRLMAQCALNVTLVSLRMIGSHNQTSLLLYCRSEVRALSWPPKWEEMIFHQCDRSTRAWGQITHLI